MSAEIVIHAQIRTAEDMAEAITKWMLVANGFERAKFDGFVVGMSSGALERVAALNNEEDKE
jgi:hypothetical protein